MDNNQLIFYYEPVRTEDAAPIKPYVIRTKGEDLTGIQVVEWIGRLLKRLQTQAAKET